MNKTTTQYFAYFAVAAALSWGAAPLVNAQADVNASVSVANMYYWRGFDLGNGDPAVSADLNVSAGGAYAGVWASSGDATNGTEYDLYLGYGQEFGDLSLGINYTSYVYPSAPAPVDPFDAGEVILTAGYGPVSVAYYHGVEDFDELWYSTVAAEFGAFSIKYGLHDSDYAHIDLGYAYNDNLSFILGVPVDDADTGNDEPNFVVSYTLPIE